MPSVPSAPTPTRETRYFISSLPAEAAHLARIVRGHWTIENSLHWVLDVAMHQDHTRIRAGHAPENLATMHHIALNLLKHERTEKLGIKNKRLAAGWDHDYLLRVIMAGKDYAPPAAHGRRVSAIRWADWARPARPPGDRGPFRRTHR